MTNLSHCVVDWIQDSLHERNIRLKKITGDYGHPAGSSGGDFASRMHNVSGVIGMVFRFFSRVLEEGQTWVVFGLVGRSTISACERALLTPCAMQGSESA